MARDSDDSAPRSDGADGGRPALRVSRATGDDLAAVERLLDTSGLQTDDVRDGAAQFYVAYEEALDAAEPAAVGGVEPAGDAALLRSVAVRQERRGDGVGSAVVRELEARAADEGVGTLVLLTTSAAGFFGNRGYERVDRGEIPDALRSTPQVASLCPESATVMRKRL